MIDLFATLLPETHLHPQFVALSGSAGHIGARRLINELFSEMGDPNGTFISDFQTHGFHGRLFELAAYAYLRSAGLEILGRHNQPDFLVTDGVSEVAIEVTTANPPQTADQDISVLKLEDLSEEEIEYRSNVVFPNRVLRSLKKKLDHDYHLLPHTKGRPLVLMIAPYFEAGSVFYIDETLKGALYPGDVLPARIPFFLLPRAKAISAIAYCNSLTVPKFWRLADHDYLATECVAERFGSGYFEADPDVRNFLYLIGHEATPKETWYEGVTIFHNPWATTPLPVGFLPSSSHFITEGDNTFRQVTGFHPLASGMRVCPREKIVRP